MKRLWLTAIAILAIGLLSVTSVSAQAVPPSGASQVNTSATIGGTGAGPTIQAFWALPDMSPGDAAMTYCSAPGNHVHTDDGNIATVPFKPNLLDSPITRQVEFFAVLSGAAGPGDIGTVYVDVFHPGGGKKFELAMTAIDNLAAQDFLGSPTTACKPLESAVHTNQVPSADASTIFTNVGAGKAWRVFHAVGVVSKDQPYGDYTYWILATAAGSTGTTQSADKKFTVLQNAGFAIDFGAPPTVDWGTIKPGVMALVQGDFIWANGIPSVMATGNVYLTLNAQYGAMTGVRYGKVIDRYFDMTVGTQTRPQLRTAQNTWEILPLQTPYYVSRILAGQPFHLDNYVLESDIPTQVDLSLTAFQAGYPDADPQATGLPSDTYVGQMWLWGSASPAANQNPYMTQNLPWPPPAR